MRFGILGELSLEFAGERRRIPGAKPAVLLARLLLPPGQRVTVERLSAAVWEGRPPRTAQASLHNHIARLRTALGPHQDRLHAAGGTYLLDVRPEELDADLFLAALERARAARRADDWHVLGQETSAALDLWRGDPLAEFDTLRDTPEVAHLRELRLQALEYRFEAHLRSGRSHEVTADLARHAADHPLHEPFHLQLMTALHHDGRTADAIAAYHRLRVALADDLGIDPTPAAQQAFRLILAGDTALDGREAAPPERRSEPGGGPVPVAGRIPGAGGGVPEVTVPAPPPSGGATAPVPLFQTPRDTADFTGRAAELASLTEHLRTGPSAARPTLVVVSGMGGMGKTTLALRAVHSTRDVFPDGQLYADLRGFGAGSPRPAHDLLARFLTDLGVPARTLPQDTDDLAALYRATLAERRVLLLLDNARDAQQVTPLLLGSGPSAVVITSRHALTGLAPTRRIDLQPFGADEQRQLLTSICGADRLSAEPVAVERILAACVGLPLALRVVGARLSQHGSRPITLTADRLHQKGRRLSALQLDHLDVRKVFLMSYQALDGSDRAEERDAAAAFRCLGLWPSHPLTAEAASALLGLPVDDTLDLLDILVNAHLLQNPVPGRYRFHDLLGEFAAELAAEHREGDGRPDGPSPGPRAVGNTEGRKDAESRRQSDALVRLVEWYTAALHAANAMVTTGALVMDPAPDTSAALPAFHDAEGALAWITKELPALTAAVRTASAGSRPELAWGIGHGLSGWVHAHWWAAGEWEGPAGDALATAVRVGSLRGQAHMHNMIGTAHGAARRNQTAVGHLAQAVDLYERIGETELQASALCGYGLVCAQNGQAQEGLAAIREVFRLKRGEPTPAHLHSLGTALLAVGDAEAAEDAFRQSLAHRRGEDRPQDTATTLTTLGDSLRLQDRREEAFACLHESLRLARKIGNDYHVAETLEALARAHLHFGDTTQARSHWWQALEIAEQRSLTQILHDCLTGLRFLDSARSAGG
ncbi:BTAD domain-containing putative transcriptional regulator [Streptomyces sp. JNUCC 64]